MPSRIIDPLAQSFFVDTPSIVTKVDLYFAEKDDDFPVYLQVRRNSGGLPGAYIVPFSEKVIYPDTIKTSSNANVATSVSFTSPLFLDKGEYSLTLGSISNKTQVYISELDGIDTVTEKRITEQPYIGSLFLSQNSSTWSPVQSQDLKFKMYRAVFDPTVTGTVTYTVNPGLTEAILNEDPLEVFPGSTTMRVYHNDHGMAENGYVYIRGVSNVIIDGNLVSTFYDIPHSDIIDTPLQISNVAINSYTVDLNTAANASLISTATRFGGLGVAVTRDIRVDTIYPVLASVKQSTGSVVPYFAGTSTDYSLDSEFTMLTLGGDTDLTESKIIAGDATRQFNLANATSFQYKIELTTSDPYTAPLIDTKQLGLVVAKNYVDNPSYNDTLAYDIVTIANTAVANVTQLESSTGLITLDDSGDQANAKVIVKGTYINITGTNPNNGQYRVIDVLEDGANIKVAKLSGDIVTDWSSNTLTITNGTTFIAEEAAAGGSVFSKYITRQVDFINTSTALNLIVDVCQPIDATVEIYYKVKTIGDTGLLSDKEFTKIDDIVIPTSLSGEFYEVTKLIDSIEPFNAMILKVVFKSTNTAQSPKIKNLRVIALA